MWGGGESMNSYQSPVVLGKKKKRERERHKHINPLQMIIHAVPWVFAFGVTKGEERGRDGFAKAPNVSTITHRAKAAQMEPWQRIAERAERGGAVVFPGGYPGRLSSWKTSAF